MGFKKTTPLDIHGSGPRTMRLNRPLPPQAMDDEVAVAPGLDPTYQDEVDVQQAIDDDDLLLPQPRRHSAVSIASQQPAATSIEQILESRANGTLDKRAAEILNLFEANGDIYTMTIADVIVLLSNDVGNNVLRLNAGSQIEGAAALAAGINAQNDTVERQAKGDNGDEVIPNPDDLAIAEAATAGVPDDVQSAQDGNGDEVLEDANTVHIPRDVLKAIEASKFRDMLTIIEPVSNKVYAANIEDPYLTVHDNTGKYVGDMEQMFPAACVELKAALRCRDEKVVDGAYQRQLPLNPNRPGPRGRKGFYELVIPDQRYAFAELNKRDDRLFFLMFKDTGNGRLLVEAFRHIEHFDWSLLAAIRNANDDGTLVELGDDDVRGIKELNKWRMQTMLRRLGQVRFDGTEEMWTADDQHALGYWLKAIDAYGKKFKEKLFYTKLGDGKSDKDFLQRVSWKHFAEVFKECIEPQLAGEDLIVIKPKRAGEKHRRLHLPYDRPYTSFTSDQCRLRARATWNNHIKNIQLSKNDELWAKDKQLAEFFKSLLLPYETPMDSGAPVDDDGYAGDRDNGPNDQEGDQHEGDVGEDDRDESPRAAKSRKIAPKSASPSNGRQTRSSAPEPAGKKAGASVASTSATKKSAEKSNKSKASPHVDLDENDDFESGDDAQGMEVDVDAGGPDSDFAPAENVPVAQTPTRPSRQASGKKSTAPSKSGATPKKSGFNVLGIREGYTGPAAPDAEKDDAQPSDVDVVPVHQGRPRVHAVIEKSPTLLAQRNKAFKSKILVIKNLGQVRNKLNRLIPSSTRGRQPEASAIIRSPEFETWDGDEVSEQMEVDRAESEEGDPPAKNRDQASAFVFPARPQMEKRPATVGKPSEGRPKRNPELTKKIAEAKFQMGIPSIAEVERVYNRRQAGDSSTEDLKMDKPPKPLVHKKPQTPAAPAATTPSTTAGKRKASEPSLSTPSPKRAHFGRKAKFSSINPDDAS